MTKKRYVEIDEAELNALKVHLSKMPYEQVSRLLEWLNSMEILEKEIAPEPKTTTPDLKLVKNKGGGVVRMRIQIHRG